MGKVFGYVSILLFVFSTAGYAQVFNDCDIALGICGNDNLNFNVNGPGIEDFPGNTSGCLATAEQQSVWLFVKIQNGTTFGFDIVPSGRDDYDYAVYGPNRTCGSLNDPVRCSYYDGIENNFFLTGVGGNEMDAGDVSEDPNGSGTQGGYTSEMNVNIGDEYYILINNFSNTNSGFKIRWTGDADLDCTVACNVDLGPDQNVCDNTDVTLDATKDNATYLWSDGTMGATLDVMVSGEYWVEVTKDAGLSTECIERDSVVITFVTPPVASPATDEEFCDPDSNNSISIDFSTKDAEIIGTLAAGDHQVLYYSDPDNAFNGTGTPLPNVYNTTGNPQRIYARLVNNANTNCGDTTSFLITSFDTPVIPALTALEDCDDNDDGFVSFTLSDKDAEVYDGQDPTAFAISYHATAMDAMSGVAPLPLTYTNTTADQQTIYVRLENNLKTDCSATASFDLKVNPLPMATATTLEQCDLDDVTDGFTQFNLNEATPSIDGGVAGVVTTYYLSLTDAMMDINPQDNMIPFTNTSNPQILTAKVTNTTTTCSSFVDLTLRVATTSIADISIDQCDTGANQEDGMDTFDLAAIRANLEAGLPTGITVRLYATDQDALLEENALEDSFSNTSNPQVLFARAEDGNNCYGIGEVTLRVLPQYEIMVEADLCDNDSYTFPDGSTGNTEGLQTSTLMTADGCDSVIITNLTVRPTYDIVIDTTVCVSDDYILPDGSVAPKTSNTFVYNLATQTYNCDSVITVNLTVVDVLVRVVDDQDLCYGDIYELPDGRRIVQPGTYEVIGPCFIDQYVLDFEVCSPDYCRPRVPTAFVPNGNGRNDSFRFLEPLGCSIQIEEVTVFNRWGELVYKGTGSDFNWNGQHNGEAAQPGVYLWTMKYSFIDDSGNTGNGDLDGSVSLLR